MLSYQLQISACNPASHSAPPNYPHIPPLHVKSLIGPLYCHLADIPQDPHKDSDILVRLVYHTDPPRCII